jgi:hypothetical protein
MGNKRTLSKWTSLVSKTVRYLRSPEVPIWDKALLLVPVIIYWILPDVVVPLPYFPLDDAAVTLFLFHWFVKRIERKIKQ